MTSLKNTVSLKNLAPLAGGIASGLILAASVTASAQDLSVDRNPDSSPSTTQLTQPLFSTTTARGVIDARGGIANRTPSGKVTVLDDLSVVGNSSEPGHLDVFGSLVNTDAGEPLTIIGPVSLAGNLAIQGAIEKIRYVSGSAATASGTTVATSSFTCDTAETLIGCTGSTTGTPYYYGSQISGKTCSASAKSRSAASITVTANAVCYLP